MNETGTIYVDFKEWFRPFTGMDRLAKGENNSEIGRSRKFVIGGMMEGIVVLEDEFGIDDEHTLITEFNGQALNLRPLRKAIGLVCVRLRAIHESEPLTVANQIRLPDRTLISSAWCSNGTVDDNQRCYFYYFRQLKSKYEG